MTQFHAVQVVFVPPTGTPLATHRATAWHEAGHAVVHLHFELPIDSITVVRNGDDLGEVLHASPMMFEGTRATRKRIARCMILSAYAGLHAERLVDPHAPDWHAQQDHENARELSRDYGVYPRGTEFVFDDVHERYLRRLDAQSRTLVRQLRHRIERLASELLVRPTMTGDQVEAFLAAQSL